MRNPLAMIISITLVVLAFGIFASAAPAQTQDAQRLRAGAAKRNIVPPFPTTMAGFFDRKDKFTGVKTPIYARALVCANDDAQLAIVATDLLCVTRELADAARAAIASKTGIPAEHILICAAHNHSAPGGFLRSSMLNTLFDQPLFDFLSNEFAKAAIDAHAALKPAKLGFGSGRLDNFARNRQQNNDFVDPEVGVLRVQEADSRMAIATLFNFTGHPVILGSDNLQLCGEYPGKAEQMVEDELGGVALFTQGACGDVTVKRSGPPFLEVERLGHVLGAEVIKTSESALPSADALLAARMEDVPVAPRVIAPFKQAKTAFDAAQKAVADAKTAGADESALTRLNRKADTAEWVFKMAKFRSENPRAQHDIHAARVQVAQIGPLVLVAIPGELFVEYGLEMKQRVRQAKNRPMMLVGYANDYLGYIVTPRAVATGGYEQATSRLDASAGRAMTEAAMTWVDTLVK